MEQLQLPGAAYIDAHIGEPLSISVLDLEVDSMLQSMESQIEHAFSGRERCVLFRMPASQEWDLGIGG